MQPRMRSALQGGWCTGKALSLHLVLPTCLLARWHGSALLVHCCARGQLSTGDTHTVSAFSPCLHFLMSWWGGESQRRARQGDGVGQHPSRIQAASGAPLNSQGWGWLPPQVPCNGRSPKRW